MTKKKVPGLPKKMFSNLRSKELGKILAFDEATIIIPEPVLWKVEAICTRFSKYKKNYAFLFIFKRQKPPVPIGNPNISPEQQEQLQCLAHAYKEGYMTVVTLEPMPKEDRKKLISYASPFSSIIELS